jgi:hypothetical protein
MSLESAAVGQKSDPDFDPDPDFDFDPDQAAADISFNAS